MQMGVYIYIYIYIYICESETQRLRDRTNIFVWGLALLLLLLGKLITLKPNYPNLLCIFLIFSGCYKKNLKQNQIKGEKSGKPWRIEGSLVAEASNLRLQRWRRGVQALASQAFHGVHMGFSAQDHTYLTPLRCGGHRLFHFPRWKGTIFSSGSLSFLHFEDLLWVSCVCVRFGEIG